MNTLQAQQALWDREGEGYTQYRSDLTPMSAREHFAYRALYIAIAVSAVIINCNPEWVI